MAISNTIQEDSDVPVAGLSCVLCKLDPSVYNPHKSWTLPDLDQHFMSNFHSHAEELRRAHDKCKKNELGRIRWSIHDCKAWFTRDEIVEHIEKHRLEQISRP